MSDDRLNTQRKLGQQVISARFMVIFLPLLVAVTFGLSLMAYNDRTVTSCQQTSCHTGTTKAAHVPAPSKSTTITATTESLQPESTLPLAASPDPSSTSTVVTPTTSNAQPAITNVTSSNTVTNIYSPSEASPAHVQNATKKGSQAGQPILQAVSGLLGHDPLKL